MGNTDYLLKLLAELMCLHLFMCTRISSVDCNDNMCKDQLKVIEMRYWISRP